MSITAQSDGQVLQWCSAGKLFAASCLCCVVFTVD